LKQLEKQKGNSLESIVGPFTYTTLVFQKSKDNYKELDIQAYDYWSSDTKQDAWFTASCFESVFITMNPKPFWIN
jgi:hypothetical protein